MTRLLRAIGRRVYVHPLLSALSSIIAMLSVVGGLHMGLGLGSQAAVLAVALLIGVAGIRPQPHPTRDDTADEDAS